MKKLLISLSLAAATTVVAENTFDLNVAKRGAAVQKTMYGLFIEDINYAADGGLYAEKVKNRSFEFPQTLQGWKVTGNVEIRTDEAPFERNPHYLRLSDPGHMHKRTCIENEGFFGISVEKDSVYKFSVWARAVESQRAMLSVEICDPASMGEIHAVGTATINVEGQKWQKYVAEIKTDRTVSKGVLRVFLVGRDGADVEHVSLFPANTWRGRDNGLRTDLAQALCDVNPGIFRFPGGCIVEGTDLESRYQWKNSVGPVENRPLNENRWNYTFPHRYYPDYYQSYGLGFYEYFLLSEDMGAEPLPVLSCGLACQFQNDSQDAHVPCNELQQYIQDALDLIEFANGDASTKWGSVRAEMGHATPFNLKYIGIGNEQWGPEYPEHLKPFVEAIRKAYPAMKIVGTSGPDSEGAQFDYLWPQMKQLGADLVDEHFYRPETWFLAEGNRYDNYDRKGPKVFAGEYACHGKGKKWNHFEASLLEAAFMTGLERNADVVHMATYAPLFAHVEGWQWRPDMIWFDNLRSVKSVSYYVQQLYAQNKGTNVAQLTMNGKAVAGNEGQNGLFASAVFDAERNVYIIKVANVGDEVQEINVNLVGIKKKQNASDLTVVELTSPDMDADNTLDSPEKIVPSAAKNVAVENGKKLTISAPAKTFRVYTFTVK